MNLYDGGFYACREKVLKMIDQVRSDYEDNLYSARTLLSQLRESVEQIKPILDPTSLDQLPAYVRQQHHE